jgi:heterodisulfide reductase subunit C
MSAPPSESGSQHSPTLTAHLRATTGVNVAACYQCGKCSAGCPMAVETTLRPHDVMRLAATQQRERLLAAESLWLCLTCEACTVHCPNGCDPARVIDALREEAATSAPRAIGAFHRSFLDQVRMFGRSFELGLVMAYKLRSGKLMQDVTGAPGLFGRGKLKLVPHSITGVADVRRIFAACEKEEA